MYADLLIGKYVVVSCSRDRSLEAIRGLVVDETKNLIVVSSCDSRLVSLPKNVVTLSIENEAKSNTIRLEGASLVGTPADRIKG